MAGRVRGAGKGRRDVVLRGRAESSPFPALGGRKCRRGGRRRLCCCCCTSRTETRDASFERITHSTRALFPHHTRSIPNNPEPLPSFLPSSARCHSRTGSTWHRHAAAGAGAATATCSMLPENASRFSVGDVREESEFFGHGEYRLRAS